MTITTRNAHEAIRAQKDFKAGALKGIGGPTEYRVFSYAVEIATWVQGTGWTVNEQRYSVTTSRHQSQVRRAINS